jgi:hypothetical protein
VRLLDTDCVAENKGERGDDGLPEADRRPIARTISKTEGSCYNRLLRGSNAGLFKERGREVTAWHGDRASVRSHGAECSEGSNGRSWHGGDAEGIFVRTSVARR